MRIRKNDHDQFQIEFKKGEPLKDQYIEMLRHYSEFDQTEKGTEAHEDARLKLIEASNDVIIRLEKMAEEKRKKWNITDKSNWTMNLLCRWETRNGLREELYKDASSEARNFIPKFRSSSKCPCFDDDRLRPKIP